MSGWSSSIDPILALSALLRLVALGWSALLAHRLRDRRLAVLSLLFGCAAAESIFRLGHSHAAPAALAALATSILMVIATTALGRMLADPHLRSAWRAQRRKPARRDQLPAGPEPTAVFERRLAEQALAESEERLRTLVNNAPVVLFALDADGVFTLSEGRELVRLGLEPGRVVGESAFAIYRDHPEIVDNLRRTLGGEPRTYTAAVGEVAFATRTLPLTEEDGTVVGLIGVATDVTERRRMEAALRTSEAKFHAAFHASPEGITINDMTGIFVDVNEGFTRLTGYTREEAIGRSSTADLELWVDPEDREEMMAELRKNGRVRGLDRTLRARSGRRIAVQFSAAVIELEGRPHILSVVRDVTERQQIELALRASEEKFHTAFRASPDAMAISRLDDGRVVEINDGFTEVFGHSMGEALGRTSGELGLWAEPTDRDRFVALLETEGHARNLEFPYRTRDGERRAGLLSAGVIELENEPHVLTVVRDITERKRAEEALRASEAKFASAFRASPDAILISSLADGRILEVNDGFEAISGYRREDAVGRTTPELGVWADPADRVRLVEAVEGEGEVRELPAILRTRSGETRPFLVSSSRFEVMGQSFMVAVARDVSELRRAETERERFVAELETKNAELERFTYTVSHDLKSPLITIRGFLGLLERDLAAGDETRIARDLERMRGATETMQRLLDELLELSRIGRMANPHERIDVAELGREAVELVSGRLSAGGIEVVVDPDLPPAIGDRQRLLEVLQNLLDNAAKFMGDEPAPRIDVGGRETDDETVIWVADNGVGIAPEYHDKIFGLFDRLDPTSDGTGIGLALVKRIVEVHGGRVWVESPGDGGGSTFFVALPKQPQAAPAVASGLDPS